MAKIVMTKDEWIEKLEKLAWSNTVYSNKYPLNVLYYNASKKQWSADCVNLLKALFNGRDITDLTDGGYQKDLSNTGDCTELQFINKCTDVSTDFMKLGDVPEVLYMSGHIGTYIGKEVEVYGQIYNVIECTAWTGDVGHTGVIYSYVDGNGRRLNHKGGYQNGTWAKHGKATQWVDYSEPESSPFSDVPVDHPKYKHIKACYDAGLVNGYSDGTFRPDDYITRADVCIIMNKHLKTS